MASLEKLKTGKWRVAWHATVKFGDNTGSVFRGSKVFKDRLVAKEFIRTVDEMEDRWRAGMEAPISITWDDLVKKFMASPIGLRKRTIEYYKFVFDKFLEYRNGNQSVAAVNGPVVRKFLDTLPSESTRNNHLSPLRSIFKFAKGRGFIQNDPTEDVSFARVHQSEKEPPTREVISRVLRNSNPYIRYRTLLLCHTGLRISEALSLKPENVQSDRLVIIGKGGKRRSIPLDNIAKLCLKKLGVPVTESDVQTGRRNWGNYIRKAFKENGIDKIGPHTMRHWFGSQLANAGIDIGRIAKHMGHTDIKLTYRTYIHYLNEEPAQTGHRKHWKDYFGA